MSDPIAAAACYALQGLLDCLHTPNPSNPDEWRVAPGMGAEFSRKVTMLRHALAASDTGPSEDAVIYGFESVSDFEDSELFKQMSGCRGAAMKARICWRAMNECRHIEQDEWYQMLTPEDRFYTFGESAPEARAEGTPRAVGNGDHSEGKS